MVFIPDKPIISAENDLLERSKFAIEIANHILDYNFMDCFTIGLNGSGELEKLQLSI